MFLESIVYGSNSFWGELKRLVYEGQYRKIVKHICVPFFSRISGVNECKQQVDTLYYLLDHYVDIRMIPKANGALRKLQRANTILLRIFHEICKKRGLTYWIDYGTLLGAVRHGGFIPWDDDIDVAMPREDYDKARKIFVHEFLKYGVESKEYVPAHKISILYRCNETGIGLDVFPVDNVYSRDGLDEELYKRLIRYRKWYHNHKDSESIETISWHREKMLGTHKGSTFKGEQEVLCHGPEFVFSHLVVHSKHVVYPLKTILFEGSEFFAPYDVDIYLKNIYGDSYMNFPHNIENHIFDNGVELAALGKHSCTDMEKVCDDLQAILADVCIAK